MKTKFITLILVLFSLGLDAGPKVDVTFKSGGLLLTGTLYLPKGDGPFPAVVFVHGSGPETRDNSSYSAKWMASIGYAALAYDKRGSGKSEGEPSESSRFRFEDLASDVVAAVNFLSQRDDIEESKIGVHAASQGGWVAPLAASKTSTIAFMIIKSASVCSVGEDNIFERSSRLRREGFSKVEIEEASELQRVEPKTTDDKNDDFTALFEKQKDKLWFSRVYGGRDPFSKTLTDYRKWYATIATFSSVPYLEKSAIPIFWIFGDPVLDQLGPVEQSLETLDALKKAGKPYVIASYEDEGHNVKEKKYEQQLYDWLKEVNNYSSFKFKKH